MSITHSKVSAIPDGPDTDLVLPSDWNAAHDIALVDGDIPATIARDSEVTTAVSDHEAAADPHAAYLTQAEGNAAYEATGAVAAHSADRTDVHGIANTASLAVPYDDLVLDLDPIAYWKLGEASGAVAADETGNVPGAYAGTITYGLQGPVPADDGTVVFLDTPAGASMGRVEIGGAALDAVFDGDEGTMLAWGRITDPAFWSQTTDSGYLVHIRNHTDGTYYLVIGRMGASGANTLSFRRRAGGVIKEVVYPSGAITDWFLMALTWSVADDEMKAYFNRAQVGTTQTGLTPFLNDFTSAGTNVLGAGSSTLQPFLGAMGRVGFWNRVLTAGEIAAIYDAANPFPGYAQVSKTDVQTFLPHGGTSPIYDWTKPEGAQMVHVYVIGGGAGGGSGRKGAAAGVRAGGGGGAGAGYSEAHFVASDLPDTVPVIAGIGGPGGAAQTVNDNSGNVGTVGNQSYFGSSSSTAYVRAQGGNGGAGGTGSAGAGGNAGQGTFTGGNGGAASGTGAAGAAGSSVAQVAGGGAGGGITAANAASAGGAGGVPLTIVGKTAATGGAATGAAGSDGAISNNAVSSPIGGTGAGGGGASTTGNAGAGGVGSLGAGGGGGGAAVNDVGNSGAGGAGGPGIVVVVTEL